MPLIRWSEKFSVGVPVFDEQHRRLVEMINQLFDAARDDRAPEAFLKLRQRFLEYAATHLRQEEAALRAVNYPDYAQHKLEHDRYVTRVRELLSEGPDVATTHDLLRFLKEWWVWHIQESDKEYSEYFSHMVQTR